jgi:hypothetical protein
VRYLTDECVAGSIVQRLREDGFDVVRAVEVGAAEDDDQVLARALIERWQPVLNVQHRLAK